MNVSVVNRALAGRNPGHGELKVCELPPQLVERLFALGRTSVLRDGAMLTLRETMGNVHIVLKGCLKFVMHVDDDHDHISALMPPGSVLGFIALDGMHNTHDVIAKGRTELLIVPQPVFLQLVTADNSLLMRVIDVLCGRTRSASAVIKDYAVSPRRRLARRLLRVAAGFGRPDDAGIAISIGFTQEEWAAMAGVSRQTINRELAYLRTANLIDTRDGRIVIKDIDGLRNVARLTESPGLR